MSSVNGVEFKINKKVIVQQSGISDFISGGTNTILSSVYVPANTFTVGDILQTDVMIERNPTTGTTTVITLYYNTTNTLSGAVSMGVYNAANLRYSPLYRRFAIRSSTNNTFGAATSSIPSDIATGIQSIPASLSINWTTNLYIILAVTSLGSNVRALSLKLSN